MSPAPDSPESRPRRSVLYVPGSNARALDKARSLATDGLILDLEDAVAPAGKAEARQTVLEAVAAGGFGPREVAIRINGLDTPWGAADLEAGAASAADAILVPKIDSAGLLERIAASLPGAGPRLWAMIETPLGVLNVATIAAVAAPLDCLVRGPHDLFADLGAEETADRLPVMAALGLTVLAARAHGLAVLDGVHNALDDAEGFRAACEQGRALGMDGKTLIHPAQIEIANEVFAPSPDALAEARRQLAAFEVAEARGEGVAVVDGRIVESLHAANARRLIGRADAIAERQRSAS